MLRLHNWPTDQPVLPLLGCQAESCVLKTRGKSELMPTHALSRIVESNRSPQQRVKLQGHQKESQSFCGHCLALLPPLAQEAQQATFTSLTEPAGPTRTLVQNRTCRCEMAEGRLEGWSPCQAGYTAACHGATVMSRLQGWQAGMPGHQQTQPCPPL